MYTEPVCSSVITSQGTNPDAAEWNEILEFNAPVGELPRATKLLYYSGQDAFVIDLKKHCGTRS